MFNEPYLSGYVITDRGIVSIDDIEIGDKLIEYRTGKLLEVWGKNLIPFDTLYKAQYSDGRVELYSDKELIYLCDRRIRLRDLGKFHGIKGAPMKPRAVDFYNGVISAPLYPDPYIAGAMLIFSDGDPYIYTLPKTTKLNEYIRNSYNLDPVLGRNKIYYRTAMSKEKITMEEFFKDTRSYAFKKASVYFDILQRYLFSSISDRIKFVRGAFDSMYDKEHSPDTVALEITRGKNEHDEVLWLQWVLWSIGVPNKIIELSSTDTKITYRLEILGKRNDYPGLFYDQDNIRNMLVSNFYNRNNIQEKYWTRLESIEPADPIYYPKERVTTLLALDKPGALYMTGQFIPKVSI